MNAHDTICSSTDTINRSQGLLLVSSFQIPQILRSAKKKKKTLSQLQALIATEKLNTTDGVLQLVLKIFTLVLGLSLLNESNVCVCA